ncbi:hypothetical protein [Streptomyces sp. NPDC058657]|uniref:hypothetical protein n=1 Tax=unclassified Streptomyces TaxID=2593676 RepID=UPI00364B4A0B
MVKKHARKNAARNRRREHAGENHRQAVDRVRHEEDPMKGHHFYTAFLDNGWEVMALVAYCTCGWSGSDGLPGLDEKWGIAPAHDFSPFDRGEAEEAAMQEWLDEHIAFLEEEWEQEGKSRREGVPE